MSTDLATQSTALEPTSSRERPAWQLAWPAIAVCVVAALVGLDRRSLWLDESFSLGATNQMARAVSGTAGNMVAYYVLLDAWTTVSQSVWWTRLLSVVLVAGSIVPLAALARRVGGPTLAAQSTLAFAAAAQVTRYAQEARSYALVMLLATTSWWLFVRAVEEADPRRRRGFERALTALAIVIVLAHGLAVLTIVALAVAAAVCPERARAVHVVASPLLAALGTVAVLLLLGANDVGIWVAPLSVDQVLDAAKAYTSPWWWVALPLGGLMVVGAGAALRSVDPDPMERWLASLAVIWAAVPILGLLALSVVRPSFDDRYLMGIAPAMALLLAGGTRALAAQGRTARRMSAGALLITVGLLLVPGQVEVHRDESDNWRGAALAVSATAQPGDGLVFVMTDHRVPFEAAWREVGQPPRDLDLVGFSRPLGQVQRFDELRDPAAVSAIAGYHRLWVVSAAEPGFDGDMLEEFLRRDEVHDHFTLTQEVRPGGTVRVTLLERR